VPAVELDAPFVPRAVSRRGVVPQGYVSGKVAAEACRHAHKRLCTHDEWTLACRGERHTQFPYGEEYRAGACNVYRNDHPAALLHGNASLGHSDPRLGLVKGDDGDLLRPTGSTPKCASRWGDDAIYDMVGNVDEWVDDPDGTFVGGFFSRSTRSGCDATVKTHPYEYWDYSTGVRCCRDPE
jgi:sulfatase modifying factor 1